MEASRRLILGALGALPFAAACEAARAQDASRYISCARTPDGAFAVALLSAAGEILSTLPLPSRGHAATLSPDHARAVVFGRRPSDFMVAIDLETFQQTALIKARDDRRFYGHGCYSADGKLLFASENAYEAADGVIGVYDAADGYRRIDEFLSGGVGPHQMILLRDKGAFAVANGGIETNPDFPRAKLNLTTMVSNLAYLDAATGALQERIETPADLRQLSLRHLAETADGAIWLGGQYEGPPTDDAPLIGIHRRGERSFTFAGSHDANQALDNYIGSLVSSADGAEVALTSPRGGVIQVWRAHDRNLLSQDAIADVCGVTPAAQGFMSSDGAGRLWRQSKLLAHRDGWSWDNHITAL